eukprot:TRINITY_DN1166_c0_g1_i5.p2 TRINITY_DN1166_c0_g1~~TRINITY_DN1166_c0_g1_i5.p2  ORF type:complete len:124 (+),score=32.31 TRINITY_DN1166_c0_g1_i5:267-638(+)
MLHSLSFHIPPHIPTTFNSPSSLYHPQSASVSDRVLLPWTLTPSLSPLCSYSTRELRGYFFWMYKKYKEVVDTDVMYDEQSEKTWVTYEDNDDGKPEEWTVNVQISDPTPVAHLSRREKMDLR